MKPLEGYRVFDFTGAKSGPVCTMLLADFGAEVIHVENPTKVDPVRLMKPSFDGTSTEYMCHNHGKKNINIDMRVPEGKKLAQELIRKCDIFVENGKPGSAAKLGLGYEDVKALRPDIVYASISGFGQNGPYRDRVAFDTVIQAMSGFMSLTGPQGGEFTKAGPSLSDIFTAYVTALGIAMAVVRRERTKEGTYLDCAMLDCMIPMLDCAVAAYLNAGQIRRPTGNRHPANAIAEPVRCKDGSFILQMFGEEQHKRFFKVMGMPDLTEDPRFCDGPHRVENRDVLVHEYVEPVLANYTLAEISKILLENKLPFGEIYTVEQMTQDAQVQARGAFIPCHDTIGGDFKICGSPFKYSSFDMPKETFCAASGEHNVQLARELLGMSDEEIKKTFAAMHVDVTL